MKQVLIILMLPIITVSLFARGTTGGMGTFGPTLGLINFKEVNAAFERAGMGKLSSQHWMFGGSGYAIANRVIIGGAGWGGTQTVTSDSVTCRVSYGGGEFRAGYAVLDLKHLLVAPTLGIGGGGYKIELDPYNKPAPHFDSLLLHPGRSTTISYSGFTLTPQLAFVIPISFIGVELRGGYTFGPFAAGWELDEHTVLRGGPKMSNATPFFSLNVLFGGFSREKVKSKLKMKIEGKIEEEKEGEEEQEE